MRFFRIFFVVSVAMFLAANANADTVSTWNGGAGNWSTAADWTPPTVPNNSGATGYDVTIGSGNVALDISPTINSLQLDGQLYAPSGAASPPALTIVNGANINGSLFLGGVPGLGPAAGPGSLSIGGVLNIGNAAQFVVQNGPVTVGGNLTNASPQTVIASETGNDQFSVGGTLTNQTGGQFFLGNDRCFGAAGCPGFGPPGSLPPEPGPTTTVGNLINNGAIYSWSNITASSLVNNGTLSLISRGASVGTLTNAGTLYLSNSCCSIAPEQTAYLNVGTGTPSNMTGYQQFADGTLDEVLSASTTYGVINAGPWPEPHGEGGYSVDLDGTLDIMLQNGFVPTIGESFTILTTAPGDLSGVFSNVLWDSFDNGQGYFTVSYDNADGDLVITAELAPEPATTFTLLPALAFLFWWAHRRRASFQLHRRSE